APSVQRFLLNASRSLSAAPELRVLGEGCWIEYFKSWLRHSENQEFPVRASQFQHYVSKFAYAGIIMDWTSMPVGDAMWFNENSELVATMMDFSVPFSFGHSASADLLAFKEQWDGEIAALSHRSPIGTGDMWGTSRLWIRAEAEQAIIYSTMNTMIVSSACAFAGALFFTRFNLPLSVLVFLTVSCVTICLAWFMSAVLGWLFGVVQVLGLIIFVGYSITYSIHIAAKYSELTSDSARSEADHGTQRREAVTQTLHAMSSPIMGSAVTTLGASFFLFFCRLQIFVKLATVLFTLLGIAGSHRRLEDSRRSGEDTELQDPAAGLGALGDLPGELAPEFSPFALESTSCLEEAKYTLKECFAFPEARVGVAEGARRDDAARAAADSSIQEREVSQHDVSEHSALDAEPVAEPNEPPLLSNFGSMAHERELAPPALFDLAPDSTELTLGGGSHGRLGALQRCAAASVAAPLALGGPAGRSAALGRLSQAQLCNEQARQLCSAAPLASRASAAGWQTRARQKRTTLKGSPRGALELPLARPEGASADRSR
ncbi:unnamed protein product, partial [Prorocentrum cordatum]